MSNLVNDNSTTARQTSLTQNTENMNGNQPQCETSVNNPIGMQPYPDPPYSVRHSRAFRHFKNPPQPHMCIKDHTHDGQELYINVMSWTKICMPHSETDPIPLYGGMRVTSGNTKSPLMFAVMANPAILKHVGRKCTDLEEKYALVKLMCDFVEAMNPGLKLARDAEVLKDRDLSGELKDIWGAIQAKRIREKDYSAPSYESYLASQNQIYIDFGPETAAQHNKTNELNQQSSEQQQQELPLEQHTTTIASNKKTKHHTNSALTVDEVDNNISLHTDSHKNTLNRLDTDLQSTTNNSSVHRSIIDNKNIDNNKITTSSSQIENDSNKNERPVITVNTTLTTTTTTTTTTTPSKKEKLGGFLPNGCHNIFPFIKTKSNSQDKNNSNKEKHDSNMANQKDQRLIHNNDTANLESEVSKLHIGKGQ